MKPTIALTPALAALYAATQRIAAAVLERDGAVPVIR